MATQGLISLMEKGKVKYKIVCGCDGNRVPDLVTKIMKMRKITVRRLLNTAKKILGCDKCLVILYNKSVTHDIGEPLGPLYLQTFSNPTFNPRWEDGTCENTYVVDIDKGE